jgi:HTH-type transcriptional regulator / antitoxin HigA
VNSLADDRAGTPAPGIRLIPAREPDYAVAPGETLRDRLDELGMTQAELAVRTGLTTKHINQVLQGVVPLSADVAQRLEYATGVPARLWNRLEADYRSTLVRLGQRRDLQDDVGWLAELPVRQLVAVGMLPPEPSDTVSRVQQLLAFFGVASPEAWRQLWQRPAAVFRQSPAHPVVPGALAAWLRLGELVARDLDAEDFDVERARELLPRLRGLTARPLRQSVPVARDMLAATGVAVVFVPEITGARAYGATRWLSPQRALIQLSLRGKTDDALWETLFHELGHVLLHGKREIFVELDDESSDRDGGELDHDMPSGGRDAQEREAWRFATRVLFGETGLARLDGVRTMDDAVDLADELGIAPSIVVARLQASGRWNYRHGARLKRPVPPLEELTGERPSRVQPRPRRQDRRRKGEGDVG